MTEATSLDCQDVERLFRRYHAVLVEHRDHLNRLNVYPVPDADTGTNMGLTMESVVTSIDGASTMPALFEAARRGALLGARGTSGVILSQIIAAIARSIGQADTIDAGRLTAALQAASTAAYEAVLRPVEGTMLTVVAAAAEAATTRSDSSFTDLVEAASEAARRALDETPTLLPVLAEAGVVDAGGAGFVLFLDTMLEQTTGRSIAALPQEQDSGREAPEAPVGPRFEVIVRVAGEPADMAGFRRAWATLGDEATVIVEEDGLWVCHTHTDLWRTALEAAREAGDVQAVEVTDLEEQVLQLSGRRPRRAATAVVAVAGGPGLGRRFRELGAGAVVAGGPTRNPATVELLEAVEAAGTAPTIILPNDSTVTTTAEQAGEMADRRVAVVPTASMAEGLSALEAFDASAPLDHNVDAMSSAAAEVVSGGVTRAARDARTAAGLVPEGTWIVMTREGLVASAVGLEDAALLLLERLLAPGTARLTVIEGADADPRVTDTIAARGGPAVEIIDGGQPHYPYLMAARPSSAAQSGVDRANRH